MSLWNNADRMGAYCTGSDSRVERPLQVTRSAMRTTRFPPCAICDRHVNDCECDPDEAQAAALVARFNQESMEAEYSARPSPIAWGMKA